MEGQSIELATLYDASCPRRVSLPTYPFEKKRYWITSTDLPSSSTDIIQKEENFSDKALPDPTHIVASDSLSKEAVEKELSLILSKTIELDLSLIDKDKSFGDYGLDSILTSRYMQSVQNRLGEWIPLSILSGYPNIKTLAIYLVEQAIQQGTTIKLNDKIGLKSNEEKKTNRVKVKSLPKEVLPLNRQGNQPVSFWVHGGTGLAQMFNHLSVHLGLDYPLYAFQARGIDGNEIPFVDLVEMAHYYVECIKQIQPKGPYTIGGLSFGGLVAYEMAQLLSQQGEKDTTVVMLDTLIPSSPAIKKIIKLIHPAKDVVLANMFLGSETESKAIIKPDEVKGIINELKPVYLAQLIKQKSNTSLSEQDLYQLLRGVKVITDSNDLQTKKYKLKPFQGKQVIYFKAMEGFFGKNNFGGIEESQLGKVDYVTPWTKWIGKKLEIIECPGYHFGLLEDPSSLAIIKSRLVQSLKAVPKG